MANIDDIKLITSYFFKYCDLFSLAFILNFFRKGVCVKHFSLPIYFIISYSFALSNAQQKRHFLRHQTAIDGLGHVRRLFCRLGQRGQTKVCGRR